MSEYNNTASAPSCAYAPLARYTAGYSMEVPPMGKVISGQYIVPQWAAIGYDDLTAKSPSCSGYPNIDNAYGKGAANCQTTYRTSVCGPKMN